MKEFRTHYDNLHVARHADQKAIKAAFRSLSQKHHPDKNPQDRQRAEEIFKMIARAYEVLSDPVKRREHDEWIARQEARNEGRAAASPSSGAYTGASPASRRYEYRREGPNPRSYGYGPSRSASQRQSPPRPRSHNLRDAGLRSSGILKALVLCRRVESSGGMIAFISMLSGVLAAATYAIVVFYQ